MWSELYPSPWRKALQKSLSFYLLPCTMSHKPFIQWENNMCENFRTLLVTRAEPKLLQHSYPRHSASSRTEAYFPLTQECRGCGKGWLYYMSSSRNTVSSIFLLRSNFHRVKFTFLVYPSTLWLHDCPRCSHLQHPFSIPHHRKREREHLATSLFI